MELSPLGVTPYNKSDNTLCRGCTAASLMTVADGPIDPVYDLWENILSGEREGDGAGE